MSGFIASGRGTFSLGEVEALVGEIEQLRFVVSELESGSISSTGWPTEMTSSTFLTDGASSPA